MSVTLREAVAWVRDSLAAVGIEEDRLEAELLLAATVGLSRTDLYAAWTDPWPDENAPVLDALLRRRLRREPLAYILGTRAFFGLELAVAPGVLIPRPETETLVEKALELARPSPQGRGLRLADVGTGSGAIAISLAVHLPKAHVSATDTSSATLETAAGNARRHSVGGRIAFFRGDLLAPVPQPVDLIVANLPYIPSGHMPHLAPEIRLYEPPSALDGGPDGLELIRRLLEQAPRHLRPGGSLLLEVSPPQMEAAAREAASALPEAQVQRARDLAGDERVLVVQV